MIYTIHTNQTNPLIAGRPTLPLGWYTSSNYNYEYNTTTTTAKNTDLAVVFEGEKADGYKVIVSVPGATKENVSVNYIPSDNVIKVVAESEVEDFLRKYEGTYYLPNKYNLDELQCSLKNGLLTISVPLEKDSKPRQIKIS